MDSALQIIRKFAVFENLWIAFLLCALILLYWYAVAPFSFFKKLGIPGPAPWPFVGNVPEMSKKPKQLFDKEVTEKYGRVCGYYLGRSPAYLISDLDLLKQITVKEFSKFTNRPLGPLSASTGVQSKVLLQAQDEDWKRIRGTITPTFSAHKLKQVAPLVNKSCETLCKKLEKIVESGDKANMWRVYGKFTMEVILSTAFGVQRDVQTDQDEPYTPNAALLFRQPAVSISLMIFPFLRPLFKIFGTLLIGSGATEQAKAAQFMINTARNVIELREQTGMSQIERKDLLELMLKAEIKDSEGKQVSKLSEDEVVAQSFVFLLAGYETTSNTLSYVTYCLALNPEVQEKLIKEIDDAVGDNETPDYNVVQNLEYLDMVICEALRLYPPAPRFGRLCNESCTLNGVKFVKGSIVLVPVYHIHRDPEYWPDPEKFDPERFSKEAKQKRNPYCFLPFGTGPRSCIGMRFALMEAKIALVYLLKRFRFQRSADTEVPLQLEAPITMSPKNGIYVKIVPKT
ncbi:Thromboxane-A synthase [Porites harrisoni]